MPNNITITEITSPSKFWEVSYNVDSAGAKTANLMTSGTFLDRNIGIKITTPSVNGSIGGSITNGTATANIANVNNITTITNITGKTAGIDYWAIKATATGTAGSYTPKYTVSSAGWLASTVNGAAQTVNVTSDTTGQLLYIPKATYGGSNGNITIATSGYLPQGEVVASMNAVTPVFDGGALNSKGATATFTNITTSTTNNGISVLAKGTAGRDAVLYNGAANGYINVADNTTASAAVASSTWNGTTYYITGITVPKDKPFSVTTTADTALDNTSNLTITNNAYRQVAITNNANGDVNVTNKGQVDITQNAVSGGVTINAYNNASTAALTGAQTVVTGGKWKYNTVTPPVSGNATTYYGATIVNPMSSGTSAAATVSASKEATAPTIARTTTAISGATNVANGNATTIAPSSGYFVSIQATAPATTLDITKTVNTAGYLGTNTQISASAATTAKTGSIYYVPVASSTPTTSYSTNSGWSTYFNSATSTDYHISITPKYSNTAGYVSAHTNTNNGGTGYWKIKTTSLSKGNGSLTLTPGNGNVTLTVGAGDSVSDTNKSMTMATAVPSSGVYYTLTAVGKGTVSGEGKGTISVGTGWISSGSLTSNSATDSKTSNEATTRGFIMKSVNGSSQTGAPPADNTLTSGSFQKIQLQPNSYVKLPAGYNPYDRYIWVASAGSSDVTQASNFNLTVSNTSGISGASAVTIGAKSGTTYPVTANNLQVTATLTANTAGWFSTGSATDSDVDSITVGTINEAVASVSVTTNLTRKPSITRTAKPSGDAWIDAASGAATTTKPTGTLPYIQVNAAANTATTTAKANITTAGYAPKKDSFATSNDITYGSSIADATYIPIKVGEATANTASADVSVNTTDGSNAGVNIFGVVGTKATTEPTSGYYIAMTASGSGSSKVTTAGWLQTGALTAASTTATKYFPITAAGITYSGGGLSNTANYTGTPTITLATNSSTNMINYRLGTQDTTNYPYYFQIKATTAKLTGTTTVTRADYKDTRTAGYLPARSSTTVLSSTTSSPSVTVNAATNTTYYFSMKKATMTVAGTNTVSPTASVAGTQATLVTKNNSGISVTATGGGTASVTATATTNAAGYAPASTQLGSATLSATNKTTTATKYLKEVEIVKPSSGTREFGIKVPNGNSTITFVFHVDSSGNVTVDNEYSLTY